MQCIQRIRRAGQHSSSTNRSVTRLRPEERLCNHRILKPSIFQSHKVDTLTVYSQAMKKDVNSLVILPDSYPEALTSGRFYRKTSPYYMQDGGGAFYINLGYLF